MINWKGLFFLLLPRSLFAVINAIVWWILVWKKDSFKFSRVTKNYYKQNYFLPLLKAGNNFYCDFFLCNSKKELKLTLRSAFCQCPQKGRKKVLNWKEGLSIVQQLFVRTKNINYLTQYKIENLTEAIKNWLNEPDAVLITQKKIKKDSIPLTELVAHFVLLFHSSRTLHSSWLKCFNWNAASILTAYESDINLNNSSLNWVKDGC